MNIVFIHGNERVKQDSNGIYYTDGSYSETVWRRYLSISNNITAIFKKDQANYSDKEIRDKFNKINENIKIAILEDKYKNIASFLSKRVSENNRNTIDNVVKQCNLLIARIPSSESYIAINLCKKYKIPYVVEVVGCAWDSLWNHSIKGKVLAIPYYLKQKAIINKSNYAIYVSNEFLQKRYPCNGLTTSCSDVELPKQNHNVLDKRLATIKEKKENEIVIGTIGAIDNRAKGQEYVFKAIKALQNKGYVIKYKLVGDGNKSYLRKKAKNYGIEEAIEFVGPIPHNKIGQFFSCIDIYIQPSLQEGLCRSLIEAMSASCPCIASNAGGNPELINRKFIFKKKKYKELINKIIELNSSKQLVAEARSNFYLSRQYQIKTLEKKRIDFYDKVIKIEGL